MKDVLELFDQPITYEEKMAKLSIIDSKISEGAPSDLKPVEELEPSDIYDRPM